MKIKIATIVPIHNELELTKKFIASYYEALYNSSITNHVALVIVDDGSSDGSAHWIEEFYPKITMLRCNGNLWWSGSVNMALSYIQNKQFTHFLLFNNDNLLDNNYFNNLIKAMEIIGTDKIISSKVFNMYPRKNIIYDGITFNRKRAIYYHNVNSDEVAIVNTAGGMGVLIPVFVINKIGFFDQKTFPQKSGDTDFYLRAERAGFRVYYYPHLIVYNDNRISGYSDNSTFQGIKNAYTYPKGYMNLKIDFKLYLRHGSKLWSIYRLIKNNIFFLTKGIIKIIINKYNIKAIYCLTKL